MRFQCCGTFPLFDHHESVRSKSGLEFQRGAGVDGGLIFQASLLGVDCRHIGAERLQNGFTLAVLGRDDGDDVDHGQLGNETWAGAICLQGFVGAVAKRGIGRVFALAKPGVAIFFGGELLGGKR